MSENSPDQAVTPALDHHDRLMVRYRAAVAASKEAEDEYLKAAAAPVLCEDAKRERRWLVLWSVAALLASTFDLKPTKIEALGVDLTGAKGSIVVVGCGAVALYLLVEFYAFARRDHMHWRRRVAAMLQRLQSALGAERGQAALIPTMLRGTAQDADRRLQEYTKEPTLPGGGTYALQAAQRPWMAEQFMSLSGFVEVVVPMLIAIAALVATVARLLH